MLILTRKAGQSIVIGTEITVTMIEIKGRTARFGVSAPRSIGIHRLEVLDRIRQEIAQRAR